MIQSFRVRTEKVLAIQFNGDNIPDLEVAVKEVCDREAFFAPVMEVGCWVILTPPKGDSQGSYQVLPDGWFNKVYERDLDALPFHVLGDKGRSCFGCAHYAPGESHCFKYDEHIESEAEAALDCDEFAAVTF